QRWFIQDVGAGYVIANEYFQGKCLDVAEQEEGRMAAWCSFGTATVATIKDSTLTPDLLLSPETWGRYTIQGCQPAENAWMQIRRRLARKAQRFRSGTVPLMTINYGLPTPLTSQTDASTLSIAVGYLLNDNTATIYRRSVVRTCSI